MSGRGYIRFYRSIWSHPAFPNEPFTRREAWTWLLTKAAWKAVRVRAGDHIVDLDRGEVPGAVRYLAAEWQWSKGKVERYIELLKIEGMIETQSGTGITIITVCNYNHYQGEGDDDGTPPAQQPGQSRDATGTRPGHRRDNGGDNRKETNHSTKEEVEEGTARASGSSDALPVLFQPTGQVTPSPKPAKKPRASAKAPLPPDWKLSDDDWNYAAEKGFAGPKIDLMVEAFKNNHIGKGTMMASIAGYWRTWVTNEIKWNGAPNGTGGARPRSRADTAIEGMFASITQEDLNARRR